MKKMERKEDEKDAEAPLPVEEISEQQGTVHYIPVRILPNGQMVMLAPPSVPIQRQLPQTTPPKQERYPNLDNVIVGAPVYQNNYNYPMKSQ